MLKQKITSDVGWKIWKLTTRMDDLIGEKFEVTKGTSGPLKSFMWCLDN